MRPIAFALVVAALAGCAQGPGAASAPHPQAAAVHASQASLRIQVQRYFKRQFAFHDHDHDAHLSPAEASELDLGPADFREADANGDGRLTFLELCPPINFDDWVGRIRHDAADLVNAADVDGDRALTPGEVATALGVAPTIYVAAPDPAAREKAFQGVDRAPAGRFNLAEVADALAALFADGYEYCVAGRETGHAARPQRRPGARGL